MCIRDRTYTVSGVGYFSNENCEVKYIYVNDDFSDNFGIPLMDGVSVDIHGCTNAEAINFNQNASIEDNSCEIYGCTDENAINFNEYANIEDESCISNIEILFETIDSLEEIITEFENFNFYFFNFYFMFSIFLTVTVSNYLPKKNKMV